jgi:hypothetical protein
MFSLFSKGRRLNRRRLCLDHMNNLFFIHPDFFVLTQKQKLNYTSYHRCYSPAPSGGLQAIEEGTYDTSESKSSRTRVQRASASWSVRSTLPSDPSSSSSDFSSGKCNMAATNAEWDPQRTSLAASVSIRNQAAPQPWA